jgi:addiction module HigA family antidote
MRRPSLPGEILRELYLAPHGITVAKFARACGVSRKHMDGIVNGRVLLTAQMATRITTALGTTTPEYWLALQNAVDLYVAQQHIAASGKRPRPIEHGGVHAMT